MASTLLFSVSDEGWDHYIYLILFAPAALLLLYLFYNEIIRFQLRVPNLPGPRGFPLVGSLPSLSGKITSEQLRKWAGKYGDVFQIQLGNSTVVVVNTTAAAEALFIRQREATNSRPIFYVLHKKVQRNGPVTSIGTSPWDDSCKRRRKVAASALNRVSVESYLPILDKESRAWLLDILRDCDGGNTALDVLLPARKFAFNLSLTVSYGTRVEDIKEFSTDDVLKEIIYIEEEISRLRETSSNYDNYIPLLRPINSIAAALGLRDGSRLASIGKRRHGYHAKLQDRLREKIAAGTDQPCIQGNVLRDPDSKGLSEGELLSISLSMMAGADTSKRTLMWACLLLAYRPDLQERAYKAIQETDPILLTNPDVANSRVEYIEALTKEIGRYFIVLRLALPKATHKEVRWNGAAIPANTIVFLNSWACSRDPAVFPDPDTFAPERWLEGENQSHQHQYAFGIGGRMCVASQLASKALYTVFLHLIAHFKLLPADDEPSSDAADPLKGLLEKENSRVTPRVRHRSSDALESGAESTVKKAKTTTSKPKKAGKSAGTWSLTKKEIGDRVKSSLALQKYHIPQTAFQMDMVVPFFRSFFVDNASLTSPLAVVPYVFDESTPVVVIEMGNKAAGELLGVSKVRGGNRMVATDLARMCVVFRPKERKCSIWSSV